MIDAERAEETIQRQGRRLKEKDDKIERLQSAWRSIPAHYSGQWSYDYDDKLKTFFVHCGGHRILDAEDSEIAHAVCLAHNAQMT